MPFPSIDQFAVFATTLDIEHSPERLEQAYESSKRELPDIKRLRALALDYVGEVSEPCHGLAFIAEATEEK
ncbi:hypothetical protein [Gordonia polyisoprenivorans]|uniref:hypothetical protein n=1 Tax=Gordonia polyisoprenivorans TaxID=84595 RepID=UPI000B99EBE0|nr:hypothetical protein [Gordonia polyisoprenivorans]